MSNILFTNPTLKDEVIVRHGLLPLMELLDSEITAVTECVLKLLIICCSKHQKMQETVCLIGMLPEVLAKGSPENSPHIRLAVADLLYQMLKGTDMTIQTLVASRCLSHLCRMLDGIDMKQIQQRAVAFQTIRNIYLIIKRDGAQR
ncbi:MAG: hypothetical protein EZS28_000083 [Streblomastix strix]|uniref:Uncharacterized protein n=1 Tax=Streblomastix strix TaxID=222440 RepID=A0A5J4XC35_9EUKA|nr:MAG: hypothetical protein EZS28_000083 [Streblomastix strix]